MQFDLRPLGPLLAEKGYVRGPFGSALRRPELKTEGIPVYEQQQAINGHRRFRFFIDEAKFEELKRFSVRPNDLIVSCSGTVGRVSVIGENDPIGIISQALLILRPDVARLLPSFLYYFLTSPSGQAQLLKASHGAVQQNIAPREIVEKIPTPIPSIAEQQKIVAVLGLLDDRIDLLRQTNATLESIAQALFKSWFVNFDPVRAKQAGREPEGMDAATAALFPAEFEESALGLIPKGWTCTRLGGLIELVYGKALKATERREGSIPVYGSGGIAGYHDEPLVSGGSVIVGRKGTVGSLYWEDRPFYPIDTTFYVRPKSAPLTFCYYAMQRLSLDRMNTDAAVPGLNRENAYRVELIKPSDAVLCAFDKVVSALRAAIHGNQARARTVSDLRDTLLPRLISGKLRLPEAQEQLEDALA